MVGSSVAIVRRVVCEEAVFVSNCCLTCRLGEVKVGRRLEAEGEGETERVHEVREAYERTIDLVSESIPFDDRFPRHQSGIATIFCPSKGHASRCMVHSAPRMMAGQSSDVCDAL